MKKIVDIVLNHSGLEGDPVIAVKADDGTYYEPVIDYQSRQAQVPVIELRLLKPKLPADRIVKGP